MEGLETKSITIVSCDSGVSVNRYLIIKVLSLLAAQKRPHAIIEFPKDNSCDGKTLYTAEDYEALRLDMESEAKRIRDSTYVFMYLPEKLELPQIVREELSAVDVEIIVKPKEG